MKQEPKVHVDHEMGRCWCGCEHDMPVAHLAGLNRLLKLHRNGQNRIDENGWCDECGMASPSAGLAPGWVDFPALLCTDCAPRFATIPASADGSADGH